jgi:hypothetical protein
VNQIGSHPLRRFVSEDFSGVEYRVTECATPTRSEKSRHSGFGDVREVPNYVNARVSIVFAPSRVVETRQVYTAHVILGRR